MRGFHCNSQRPVGADLYNYYFRVMGPKIGILGGGQLGKMLVQAGSAWDLNLHVLDKSKDFPAASVCPNFHLGDFTNFEDVVQFGQEMDIITVEIESINVEALEHLEALGKAVYPSPQVIRTIRDKGLQKMFYRTHQIPTSAFDLFANIDEIKSAINSGSLTYPFVQKSRIGGYDGRGVAVIHSESDLAKLLPVPSLVEDLVDIDKEIAVIVAGNGKDWITYPCVEMLFHPTANLVEFLGCPAALTTDQAAKAHALAMQVAQQLDVRGLLAVELFLTKSGDIIVNEAAPRPHNSGHHTIEAAVTSQFQQHLRAILGYPLGSTAIIKPAVMINLLGAPDHSGPVHYQGLQDCLSLEGVFIHLYGKQETRPFRKMGHATILGGSLEEAKKVATKVQSDLEIISASSL